MLFDTIPVIIVPLAPVFFLPLQNIQVQTYCSNPALLCFHTGINRSPTRCLRFFTLVQHCQRQYKNSLPLQLGNYAILLISFPYLLHFLIKQMIKVSADSVKVSPTAWYPLYFFQLPFHSKNVIGLVLSDRQ